MHLKLGHSQSRRREHIFALAKFLPGMQIQKQGIRGPGVLPVRRGLHLVVHGQLAQSIGCCRGASDV